MLHERYVSKTVLCHKIDIRKVFATTEVFVIKKVHSIVRARVIRRVSVRGPMCAIKNVGTMKEELFVATVCVSKII